MQLVLCCRHTRGFLRNTQATLQESHAKAQLRNVPLMGPHTWQVPKHPGRSKRALAEAAAKKEREEREAAKAASAASGSKSAKGGKKKRK